MAIDGKRKWRRPSELVHHDMPPLFCPSCFTMFDVVTGIQNKEKPEPGDFTICIECAAVLRYDKDMTAVLSSLMEVPMISRMNFARVVSELKERGPRTKRNSSGPLA